MSRRPGALALAALMLALAAAGLWRAAAPPSSVSPEARVEATAASLRCPVCQGLSVADSPSKMAQGMRAIVAEQLAAGRSPDQVRDWFVDRYGQWVLLSPSPSGLGWLVWLLPVAAVTGAGATAIIVARRRRRRGPVTADDLVTAEKALVAYESGALLRADSLAGERLESAIALVEAVRSDRAAGMASAAAEGVALARVADAARAIEAEQGTVHTGPPDRSESAPRPGRAMTLRRVPMGLRWAGLASAFLLALAGVLAVHVAPRAEGGPVTGSLPEQEDASPASSQLDRLRAAAPQNPQDTRTRLVLIARMLRAGRPDEARTHIADVLAASPKNPDALLLLGIMQVQEADPGARSTFRHFLSLAPSDHPGVPVAEGLLRQGKPR
ncbi:MAG: cytochrome c-type biogenesis protein CcmH [Actinomycetota bacterium]|nr:cytochrome c-type biogenesis protein CcmH [Actinomycetota bacterium]